MKKNHLSPIVLMSFTIAVILCVGACKKDVSAPVAAIPSNSNTSNYSIGVFTVNQGPFNSGTGTISYYNRTTKAVTADLFQLVNQRPLGNVAQSMQAFNGKAYIVVNNDAKTEVVNATTFASTGTITNLAQPRYFVGLNSTTGYISQWGANGLTGSVAVVNLQTNKVTSTIPTGKGAENMLLVGGYLYVACSGGDGIDSVVTVINTTTNTVAGNIWVGPNPQSLQIDASGKIWVLCGGEFNSSYTLIEPSQLVRINPFTNTVELTLPFNATTASNFYSSATSPSNLIINPSKGTLYYLYNGAVYSQSTTASTLATTPIINESFYGLGIDSTTNYLYAANAGNYTNNGWVVRFTTTGAKVDSFQVGIIPGNFCFE